MASNYTVELSKVMKNVNLTAIYMPEDPDEIIVTSPDVSRAGLELNGFIDYMDATRLHIFGTTE